MTPTASSPDAERATTIADEVRRWYRRAGRELPWRADGFSAWGTLVSEIMLQQTPAARVAPSLTEWLERWPTPAALATAGADEVLRAWGRLGYPRRALRLRDCAVAIVADHDGIVPDDVETLKTLPGIGDYTARAIAVFAYGRRHPVVDTNVRRVLARALVGQGEPAPPHTRRDLAAMETLLPHDARGAHDVNAAVMELGALVCTARAPACRRCPIRDHCAWYAAGRPAYHGPRRRPQARYEGSDRHARGTILRALREADRPLSPRRLAGVWPSAEQRERALAGLVADGLAEEGPEGYRLPSGGPESSSESSSDPASRRGSR